MSGALLGELDMASAERFARDALAGLDGHDDLVLDLSGLSFVDSTGVRAFLQLAKTVDPKTVVLRNPQPSVAYLLELVRIGSFGIRIEPWRPTSLPR
ncbi:MAG: STAS domain-containing protein [Actinomycetota bacterium]